MQVILYLIKIHFIIIYFFIKLFTRQRKRVYLLSRQFDSPSINYQIIIDELKKKNIDYKVKCKKVETSINDSMRTQGHYSNTVGLIKRLFGKFKSSIPYYFSLLGQMVDIAKSKVIIVDGYNLPVSLLKHKKGTKVIQQWHALGAIKKFGYQSIGKVDGINPKVAKILKMHAGYDYVISGSEGMNKYFAEAFNVPEDKVLAIGTPSIDFLKKVDPKVTKNIYKKYPEMKNKINVLYSPTFRNEKNYNYQELIDNTDFNKVNLIITNHFKIKTHTHYEDQKTFFPTADGVGHNAFGPDTKGREVHVHRSRRPDTHRTALHRQSNPVSPRRHHSFPRLHSGRELPSAAGSRHGMRLPHQLHHHLCADTVRTGEFPSEHDGTCSPRLRPLRPQGRPLALCQQRRRL